MKGRPVRKILYAKKQYMLLETYSGLVVVNSLGTYDNHGHVSNFKSGVKIIDIMAAEKIPKGEYPLNCAIRVVTNRKYKNKLLEYKALKEEKKKDKKLYININKGVK